MLGWLLTLGLVWALWRSPWVALGAVGLIQLALALLERLPALRTSPPSAQASPWHPWCLRMHVALQAVLLAVGVAAAVRSEAENAGGAIVWSVLSAMAAGVAAGWVSGSLGITYAHELGHRRSKGDRLLAWLLMGSVLYAHFMVEHYRGHHPRAATRDDPATARRGESLWRFLPRTLAGSWRSAWALEAERLRRMKPPRALQVPRARWPSWAWTVLREPEGNRRHLPAWSRSPLAWATAAQAMGLIVLAVAFGWTALVFWLTQAAMAVFLLETVNYVEHYGLERTRTDGRLEPFGMQHAWNADAALTNALLANLQRHSDHHVHPWKPYETLQPLPGPQLPTGYAGCVMLAWVPSLWRRVMEPRLAAWSAQQVAPSR